MATINDRTLSLMADRHPNYLAEVKHANPEKYNLIKELGGIVEFEGHAKELKEELVQAYFQFIDEDTPYSFVEMYKNYAKDMTPNYATFHQWFSRDPFAIGTQVTMKAYNRNKELVERWKLYKGRKDAN